MGLGLSLLACSSSDRAPNHPISDIYDRNASKIEIVPLIINDTSRAAQVQAVYRRIATLSEKLIERRGQRLARIEGHLETNVVNGDEVQEEAQGMREEARQAYEEYVQLQMDLRRLVRAEEFAKLDKVR